MTARAWRQPRSVLEIVESTRAVRAWIDEQLAAGRTEDEIVAMAPTAIAFINGDLSLSELAALVEAAR